MKFCTAVTFKYISVYIIPISDKPVTGSLKKDLDENTVGFDWHKWWLENGLYTKKT